MPRIYRTSVSHKDYLDIWTYIAADNIAAADALLDTFDAKLAIISGMPRLGRARPELGPDIRSFPIHNYVLFYREVPDGVQLLRVLHGAQNLPDFS